MTALAAVPDRPDTSALAAESTALVTSANAIAITDSASYQAAVEFGKGVKALQKKITDFFAPHKQRAHAVWKALCDDERSQITPTEEAERIVKRKLLDFKRQEDARAEVERREREAHARKLEEERRLQEAIEREEDGDVAAADDILNEPVRMPIVSVPQASVPKIAGVATPKRWTIDETKTDLAAIVKHIAGVPQEQKLAHPELLHILALDTKTARQLVVAMKEHFNVPGIAAGEVENISLGSR
jgi:hypothetical protein